VNSPKSCVFDRYCVGEVLGQGSFGIVSLARDKHCGRDCVLKVVERDGEPDAHQPSDEVAIHASLDHPNIVRIYETFEQETQLHIVMELCRGGELGDAVENAGGVCSEIEAKHVFRQVMQAVRYMHCEGLAHRDLKLDNFLIKEPQASLSQCTIKLIDFGMASRFIEAERPSFLTMCGTPDYVAPEILSKAPYNEKCDVWSCGVILYRLLSGDMPFDGASVEELFKNLKAKPVRFPRHAWKSVSHDAQSLVRRTCCKVVAERLSAQQVLAESWLQAPDAEAEAFAAAAAAAAALSPEMVANAESFGEMSPLQRASLHRVAYYMEDEHINGTRDVFLRLDSDCDGRLTKEDLLQGASQGGLPMQDSARMEELFDQLDSDGSGALEYTEFLAAMTCHQSRMSTEACKAAFRSFDTDGSGTISVQEIQRIFQVDGTDKVSTEGLKEAFRLYDTDGDGKICFKEFLDMLHGNDCSDDLVPAIAAATIGGA